MPQAVFLNLRTLDILGQAQGLGARTPHAVENPGIHSASASWDSTNQGSCTTEVFTVEKRNSCINGPTV